MEGRLPRGVFSNVVLRNEMGRTEDYRDRRVSLNARQMELDGERRFRIVVAHRDPGLGTGWIPRGGRAARSTGVTCCPRSRRKWQAVASFHSTK